jgi:hypothetical protein
MDATGFALLSTPEPRHYLVASFVDYKLPQFVSLVLESPPIGMYLCEDNSNQFCIVCRDEIVSREFSISDGSVVPQEVALSLCMTANPVLQFCPPARF